MLIKHTFDYTTHLYRVPGHYVFSTSDILELSGVVDIACVPKKQLDRAAARGSAVHSAIELYETGGAVELEGEAHNRFLAFLRFREHADFQPVGPMERSIVYEHEGTGVLIGGTPDCIAMVYGQLFVCDFKTSFRTSGKRRDQQHLAWRLQLQSYREGLMQDESLMRKFNSHQMHRGVVHLHPDCGIVKRGQPRLGFEWNAFHGDDSMLWDWCITKALENKKQGKQVLR